MTEQSPRVLVARCENYREDVDAPCTGEIRFRWGMSQSDPCDVCGSRCGVAVAAWERVESADPSPASPGTLAIVRDLVTTLDEFVEEHSDPGTRALGVPSEARRFISTGGTGHVEDSPEVDAIAETINAVVGMSVPFPKLMAAARGVEKLIEARRAGAVPDTGQARADRLAAGIWRFADDCKLLLDFGGLDNRVARSIAQQERNLRALLDEPSGDTGQAREPLCFAVLPEEPPVGGLVNRCQASPRGHGGPHIPERPPGATVQAPDEMEEHFVDANERLGEALVEIGMAIGLPRPTAQFHWGAPEILARIAEYDRIQVWVCDVEGHAEIPCRRCHLGAEGKPTPMYRYSGPRRTGQVADPMDDLARLDSMIAAAPADYPGLPLIRRHRDEVRTLLGTDTTPDRLAWISEAGETAAAERQARYRETACARRPAEERPDA